MFCIHCGQELPDEAKFCFKCGKKPYPESFSDNTDVTEAVKAEHSETPPVFPSDNKNKKKTNGNKRRFIALGLAVLLLISTITIILSTIPKITARIPDPEVYFSLPLTKKSAKKRLKFYTYKVNGDIAVFDEINAYIDLLLIEHDYLLTNKNSDEDFLQADLYSKDDYDAELTIYYYYEEHRHEITFMTTKNIGFCETVRYSGVTQDTQLKDSETTSVIEAVPDTETTSPDTQTKVPETKPSVKPAETEPPVKLSERSPSLLPEFTDYDSSGSFKHYLTYLTEDSPELLVIGYESFNTSATYVVEDYLNALYEMGYQLDENWSYTNNDKGNCLLYHPEIDSPVIAGIKAQMKIDYRLTSNKEALHVYIRIPKAMVMEGFENAYAEEEAYNKAHPDVTTSSSNKGSSNGNSGGTPDVDMDIYDVKSRCGVCDGSGNCRTCGGDGKLYSSASGEEDRNCYSCNNFGDCGSCGGDGWVGD